ncbi:MAG TPA: hypothetical protein VKT27_09615 [Candidatus Binataceae bacterium]|nr:hypothetical protein [Candidatus Binataceae bacterium]
MAAHEFHVREGSRRDQLIAIGASLVFVAAIGAALWLQPQFRLPYVWTFAGAALVFFVWTLMREVRGLVERKNWPVVIDEQGVHYASPGQIGWTEIAGLEPVPARQCVDLQDAEGRARVSLPYDLEDAHEVVQFVADMLIDRWPKLPLPYEFAEGVPRLMLAGGAIAAAALVGMIAWTHGRPVTQIPFGAALALLFGACGLWRLRSVRRMTVDRHELLVVKGIRPRVFSYADIEAVSLSVVGGKAERRLDVKVSFRDGTASYVLPWRCDPFEVYAAVKAAWEQASGSASSAAAR